MTCTPFAVQAGLFESVTQGVWNNFGESGASGRSVSYSGGTLTVVGPNGTTFSTPAGTQVVRHRFFGGGNFLAVLISESGSGPISHWMHIVNFVAPAITSQNVMFVSSDSSHSLPFLQPK